MKMKIIAIGKKHEKWVASGIEMFEKRLKKPFEVEWQILAHFGAFEFCRRKSS